VTVTLAQIHPAVVGRRDTSTKRLDVLRVDVAQEQAIEWRLTLSARSGEPSNSADVCLWMPSPGPARRSM